MSPEDVARLDQPEIQRVLRENTLPADRAALTWRKHHPDWPVAAMAEQVLISAKAKRGAHKLGPLADYNLLYESTAYEQSSHYACARLLAQRCLSHAALNPNTEVQDRCAKTFERTMNDFDRATTVRDKSTTVLDACAGMGIDALVAAQAGYTVTAIEADPGRAELLRRNSRQCDLNIRIINGKSPQAWPKKHFTTVYADFDRRSSGKRHQDPGSWSPEPKEFCRLATQIADNCWVKCSPGTKLRDLSAHFPWQAAWLVSVQGENKQWLLNISSDVSGHEINGTEAGREIRSICLYEDGRVRCEIASTQHNLTTKQASGLSQCHAASYILIPDPAIRQSGLTPHLADQLGARVIAGSDWIGNHDPLSSEWGQVGKTIQSEPCAIKAIPKLLQSIGVRQAAVRWHGGNAQELSKKWKLAFSPQFSVLVLGSRHQARAWVVQHD